MYSQVIETSPFLRGSKEEAATCTLFGAREERLLGSLRRQRIILRLADALIVMDSRLVIRVENMVTTSSLEVSEVDLNGRYE